jgi:integrase
MLRDRTLCGLCLKVGRRSHSFIVATSVHGRQVRVTLGRWPLIRVDEARELALPILLRCRAGEYVVAPVRPTLPTLRQLLTEYAKAKRVKASSLARYDSVLRTHFTDWMDRPVSALKDAAFATHCHEFAQCKGAAVVDLGRGIVGSMLRYLGAVHGVDIPSPFVRLSHAGLMPERPKPRGRTLVEADLSTWSAAVDSLAEVQRDYLRLLLLTGLRKNEGVGIRRRDVDFAKGVLLIPETKGKRPHSLPMTPLMRDVLERRCDGREPDDRLFEGLSADHVTEMAVRAGAPQFTLHDLRKLLASVAARQGVSDAILRRILGHAPKRGDVLHRHYVSLDARDVAEPLEQIQAALSGNDAVKVPKML